MTAELEFISATVEYPIYNAGALSLRNTLISLGTGGRLRNEAHHVSVVTALDDVSFHIRSGDAVGLVGHNGAGKSTLLRTMAGVYSPVRGQVRRLGKVATMFELGAGTDPELSGYENIIRMGLMMGMSLDQARATIPEIEEFTELGDFLQLPLRTYSAGMSMRLMFAVATSAQPDILLVDEIFGAGDEAFKERASERMKSFVRASQIFVLASHSVSTIKEYCNRAFLLEHGRLREVPVGQL